MYEGTIDEDGTHWTLAVENQFKCSVGLKELTDVQGDASMIVPGKVIWRTCEDKLKCTDLRQKMYRRVWGPSKKLFAGRMERLIGGWENVQRL